MIHAPTRHRRTAAAPRRGGRLPQWLVAVGLVLVLTLQFLAATQHHHELTAKHPHCASCTLHAQPHAGPPPVLPAPTLSTPAVLRGLVQARPVPVFLATPAFLLPPAHGPPAFLPPY